MPTFVQGIGRLKAQLLTSGIQEKNQPLYQVIDQLLILFGQFVNEVDATLSPPGGGGVLDGSILTKNNETATLPNSLQVLAGSGIQFNDVNSRRVILTALPFTPDNWEEGEIPIIGGGSGTPGAIGPAGPTGAQGNMGSPGFTGPEGEDGPMGLFPGPTGATGPTGGKGDIGMPGIPGEDGIDGIDGFSIVGPVGARGATGSIGPPGIDAEESEIPYIIPGPQGPAGSSGGGGNFTYLQTEVNLGAAPGNTSGFFDIVGAGLTINKNVLVQKAVGPYTGKGTEANEAEMEIIDATGLVTSAVNIRVYWASVFPIIGNVKFNYVVSA